MVLWLIGGAVYAGILAYNEHRRRVRTWQSSGPLSSPSNLTPGESSRDTASPSCTLAVRLVELDRVASTEGSTSGRHSRGTRITDPFLVLKIGQDVRVTSILPDSGMFQTGYPSNDTPFLFPVTEDRPESLHIYIYGKKRRRRHYEDRLKAAGRVSLVQALANGGEPISVDLFTRKNIKVATAQVAVTFWMDPVHSMASSGEAMTLENAAGGGGPGLSLSKGLQTGASSEPSLPPLLLVYGAESLPYIAIPDGGDEDHTTSVYSGA